jgi:predicted GNAT family N-acyltransferase
MPDKTILIRTTSWDKDRETLQQIRRRVFIEEQQVPEEMEWDEDDSTATHFLVSFADIPVATARLKCDGQLGRMAVLPACRHQGTGSSLLKYILHHAARNGLPRVYLHAQLSAVAFYARQGFVADGDIFHEAGIPHRLMSLNIQQK